MFFETFSIKLSVKSNLEKLNFFPKKMRKKRKRKLTEENISVTTKARMENESLSHTLMKKMTLR